MTGDAGTLTISDGQRVRLIDALVRSFGDGPAIGRALRDAQENLVAVFSVDRGAKDVASDAVQRAIDQEQVPRLLRLAVTAAPISMPLRTLVQEIDPSIVLPPLQDQSNTPGTVAFSIDAGVEVLANYVDEPEIERALRMAADPLKSADEGITKLVRYKALHDGLHSIPYRLGAIATAAGCLSKEGEPAKQAGAELAAYAADLGRLVDQARQDVAGLPDEYDRDQEQSWIDDLQQYARQLRQAARGDPALARTAMEAIGSLQRQRAPFINRQLVNVAGTLPLRTLYNALDLLVPALQRIQQAGAAAPFQEARRKLLDVEREFEGAVDIHKQWQKIDAHLSLKEHTIGLDRNASLLARTRCADSLRRLIAREAAAPWAVAATQELPLWLQAEEDEDEPAAAAAFQDLRGTCRDQFMAVDKLLLAMCGKLDVITKPLGKLRNLAER